MKIWISFVSYLRPLSVPLRRHSPTSGVRCEHKRAFGSSPYEEDFKMNKKDANHVSNWMTSRLRNLKTNKEVLGGKSRLAGSLIDQLSSYYGPAIHQNSDSTEEMMNAIWVRYFHKISEDEETSRLLPDRLRFMVHLEKCKCYWTLKRIQIYIAFIRWCSCSNQAPIWRIVKRRITEMMHRYLQPKQQWKPSLTYMEDSRKNNFK